MVNQNKIFLFKIKRQAKKRLSEWCGKDSKVVSFTENYMLLFMLNMDPKEIKTISSSSSFSIIIIIIVVANNNDNNNNNVINIIFYLHYTYSNICRNVRKEPLYRM